MQPALTIVPAPPAIAEAVESFWYAVPHHTAHVDYVISDARFHLYVDLRTGCAAISGLRSRYAEVHEGPSSPMMGAVLRPAAARALIAAPAAELLDRSIPLRIDTGDTLPQLAAALRRALRPFTPHPAVQYALSELRRAPRIQRVDGIARDYGLSRRRLAQLFQEQVGMPPKRYCRLLRFREVVRCAASGAPIEWAGVALDSGYCDQPHLTREFREFSGLSPAAWLAAEHPFPNHVRVA